DKVWFWNTATGKIVGQPRRFPDHTHVSSLWFRSDSHALAAMIQSKSTRKDANGKTETILSDPRLQILEVPSGRMLKKLTFSEVLKDVAFHPHGNLLACVGDSNKLELRDAETGEVRGPISPMDAVNSVAFDGDGTLLFVGKHFSAELWELDALLSPGGTADKAAKPDGQKQRNAPAPPAAGEKPGDKSAKQKTGSKDAGGQAAAEDDWPMGGYDVGNTYYNRAEKVLKPPLVKIWEVKLPTLHPELEEWRRRFGGESSGAPPA
ncbi:MAG: WD40 repeat domain-containing protein, partial [Pirellulales bacterium]